MYPEYDNPYDWKCPVPPKTDQEFIDQVNQMKSFLGSIVKLINQKEHDTAYILMDRSRRLMESVQKAMENVEP